MWPVSAAFLAAVGSSHQVVSRVDVLRGGQRLAVLQPTGGQVTVDRTNAVRRRCSMQLTDPTGTLTPAAAADVLSPYGTELAVWRGVVLPGGVELAPLGVFGVASVTATAANGLTLTVEGYDRARRLGLSRLPDIYTVTAGAGVNDATTGLLASRFPGLRFSLPPTSAVTPLVVLQPGADPWAAAAALQAALGRELYVDPVGTVTASPVPDPATSPVVATYTAGPQAVILDVQRRLTDDGIINHVVVSGQSTSLAAPVRGEAYDTDPTSPTFIGVGYGGPSWVPGPVGDLVQYVTSPLPTSADQATAMAAGILRDARGSTEQLQFTVVPNPAHDAGDVVQVVEQRSRTSGRYVIDSMTVPLDAAGALQATGRRRSG